MTTEIKPPRDIKALILQMKLDANYEMRVLAEEEIIKKFDDLLAENDRLKKELEEVKKNSLFSTRQFYGEEYQKRMTDLDALNWKLQQELCKQNAKAERLVEGVKEKIEEDEHNHVSVFELEYALAEFEKES